MRLPASEVELHIPKELDAFFVGHVHTNPKDFLHIIPGGECLVSPIVEFQCIPETSPLKSTWFRIDVPHCLQPQDIKKLKVRHGDIRKNIPFAEVPSNDCYFRVYEKYVTIFTRHFSQFVCTSCEKICHGEGKALIFGSNSPAGYLPKTASLRLYVCSPLFRIADYKMVSSLL